MNADEPVDAELVAIDEALERRQKTDLQLRLEAIEVIPNEHRRRLERAKLMSRVGRWVVKHQGTGRYDKDGNKLEPRRRR